MHVLVALWRVRTWHHHYYVSSYISSYVFIPLLFIPHVVFFLPFFLSPFPSSIHQLPFSRGVHHWKASFDTIVPVALWKLFVHMTQLHIIAYADSLVYGSSVVGNSWEIKTWWNVRLSIETSLFFPFIICPYAQRHNDYRTDGDDDGGVWIRPCATEYITPQGLCLLVRSNELISSFHLLFIRLFSSCLLTSAFSVCAYLPSFGVWLTNQKVETMSVTGPGKCYADVVRMGRE